MEASALSFIESALSTLEHSVQERSGELRNIQLATISPDGRPAVRTAVLRAFDRAGAMAEIHTDARADKARDIASASAVSFVAWDGAEHLQLRFDGAARLHRDDDVARDRWEHLPDKGRVAFGLRAAPGEPVADPEEQSHLPGEEQFRQFSVILVALTDIDVLRLEPEGRQTRARARFGAPDLAAAWIGP